MAFLHCELFSDALGMATAVNVILPDKGALGDAATVLILHGLSDNCTGWTRYTSVERYARERGLAVIMPECSAAFIPTWPAACRISPMFPRSCPRSAAGCSL